MATVKISALPAAASANANAVIPATNAAGTETEKVTVAQIVAQAPVQSVAGKTGSVTLAKADVGLGNVDNTSDASKPISTATQTALDGKAATSHTHAAGDVTSGTFNIARIPTGTTSSTVCLGNDARLSDSRTPTSHTHGNLTNDGKVGSTSGLPLITTTNGAVTTGSFGSGAGSFCEGSDGRLSDSRTPTAHKTSHAIGGSDALSPADIGAPASDTTGIAGADAITNIVSLTQAEYDAITTPNASTLYVIT